MADARLKDLDVVRHVGRDVRARLLGEVGVAVAVDPQLEQRVGFHSFDRVRDILHPLPTQEDGGRHLQVDQLVEDLLVQRVLAGRAGVEGEGNPLG